LRSSSRAAAALLTLCAAAGLFAGCAAPADRPDPTTVVSDYLTAIAKGDAATAAELDSAAEPDNSAAERDSGAPTEVDADTLRTDDVLSGAAELISDVEVDPDPGADVRADDAEARRVSFRFTLDGEEHDSSLSVVWDDAAKEWRLDETLAGRLFVTASASTIAVEPVAFRLPGATVTLPEDPDDAPLAYLAYPAVYEITADVPEALLADAAEGTMRRIAVTPESDASVDIGVRQLPSAG
jgi:hypothetical protein